MKSFEDQTVSNTPSVTPSSDEAMAAGAQLLHNLFPLGLDLQNLTATRLLLAEMHAQRRAPKPAKMGVSIELHDADGVLLRLYRPMSQSAGAEAQRALPVLVWLHGGGFVLGDVAWEDKRCMQLARDVGCVVVAVAYRLAPEHPYPAALHDSATALRFLRQHAATLAIDGERVALGGASAGAGLAAALALWLRDQQLAPVCLQLLLYPMLDDRTVLSAALAATDAPIGWSLAENTKAWQYYLADAFGREPVSPYAAAARAADLQGLPPTLICVGSADLFAAECHDYATRLQSAGVLTEFCWYRGAFHGFDSWAAHSLAAKDCWQRQVTALRQAFFAVPQSDSAP